MRSSQPGRATPVRHSPPSNPPSRVFYTASKDGIPYFFSSLLHPAGDEEDSHKSLIAQARTEVGGIVSRKRKPKPEGTSYVTEFIESDAEYDPHFLDDPSLTAGRHCTVLNLPGMRTTLIPYVRKKKLKENLNQRFHEKHPNVRVKLTSIRSVKKSLLQIGVKMDLDIGTMAHAFVYFEKLVLSRYVGMDNRKKVASVCLLLAIKFYHNSTAKAVVAQAVDLAEKTFSVGAKDLFQEEVKVFIELKFKLQLEPSAIQPHYLLIQEHMQVATDAPIRTQDRLIL